MHLVCRLEDEQKDLKCIRCASHLELKMESCARRTCSRRNSHPSEVAALQKQDVADHLPCPRQHWHDGTPRAMSGRGHRPGGRNPFEAAAGAGDSEPVMVVGWHPAAPPAYRVVACGYLCRASADHWIWF